MGSTAASLELARCEILARYRAVRKDSVAMCEPLQPAEYRIQPIPEVSPPWWNLGHTSWFFARNVLQAFGGDYRDEDAALDYVLNSYYVSLGRRLRRDRRGLMTRPTTEEIYDYRASVDRRVERLVERVPGKRWDEFAFALAIGIEHEQQHQELFYTEIKRILAENPPELRRAYRVTDLTAPHTSAADDGFVSFEGGLFEFGHQEGGWCWDNELPVHKYYLRDFAIQERPVTNGEYQEFIDDGGYRQPLVWLDNGWRTVEEQGWQAPLYWERRDGSWQIWTLAGARPLDPREPVCHVSFYEADAFARWRSETCGRSGPVRLPTEREWEQAARASGLRAADGNYLDNGRLHPAPAAEGPGLRQMFGDVWEWTASYYEPYPGYRPFPGALAEYNGKFMDNQRVLRGGSCVSPSGHIRASYRNFWPADTRFQFTGIRLARDVWANPGSPPSIAREANYERCL